MLRVLSKALARHLQKYPDQGYSSCVPPPERVLKNSAASCHTKEDRTASPTREASEDDNSKLLQTLTPQLEKHLLLKNTYIPELVTGMKSVSKVQISKSEGKSCKPTKPESKVATPIEPACPAQKERVVAVSNQPADVCVAGRSVFQNAKCPVQVERIKQSLTKRAELRKKSQMSRCQVKNSKSKDCQVKPDPVKKVTANKVKSSKPNTAKGVQANLMQPQDKSAERKQTQTKSSQCNDSDIKNAHKDRDKFDKKSDSKDSLHADCFGKQTYSNGWAKLARDMEVKSPEVQRKPKTQKNEQVCFACVEELWEGGQRGDGSFSSTPVEGLENMVKAQTDKLTGKLNVLGRKIEQDIKGILLSWEAASKKAQKAVEESERNHIMRTLDNTTSLDYNLSSFNEFMQGQREKVSQYRMGLHSNECSDQDIPGTDKLTQKEAHRRLINMLRRVRAAVHKSRALPSSIAQPDKPMSRQYSTASECSEERKEMEDLYDALSAKGEILAKDLQCKIRRALKDIKG